MTLRIPSIYIHIPFCASKCYYCDFNSYTDKDSLYDDYFKALESEICKGAKYLADNSSNDTLSKIQTVYIGGGTPSCVPSHLISSLVSLIIEKFNMVSDPEITIECNPGTVDKRKVSDYKSCGINRISIGLQSSSDRILRSIGRKHTYSDFTRTYSLFFNNGFNNINVDIIEGLPGQSFNDFSATVDDIVRIGVEHVSVYSLSIGEGSRFYREMDSISEILPDDEDEREMYHHARKSLISAGFIHYEISNFACPGYESKHNILCWKGHNYFGFGAGAHSYIGNRRAVNEEEPSDYIRKITDPETVDYFPASDTLELLSDNDIEKEFFLLGFRLLEGINLNDFQSRFGTFPFTYSEKIGKLIESGYLTKLNNRFVMTLKGLDYANFVFREFV